jgi:hypothetical protein
MAYFYWLWLGSCVSRTLSWRRLSHTGNISRFCPMVSLCMFSKFTGRIEVFPTLFTFIRFYSSVNWFRCFQVTVCTKGFSTLFTCKGLLSSVSSFMCFQVTGRTKSFSTVLTYIGFSPLWVCTCFWRSLDLEGLPTFFTCVRFHFSVNSSFLFFWGNWMN